jgi:hypothetical protein
MDPKERFPSKPPMNTDERRSVFPKGQTGIRITRWRIPASPWALDRRSSVFLGGSTGL